MSKTTSVEIATASRRPVARKPDWPERLRALAVALAGPSSPEERERRTAELWPLLYGALARYVRSHASRYGTFDSDLAHDIASEKAIDLLGRIDRETWNPGRWSPGQLAGLLSRMARNGVIDHLRSRRRIRDANPAAGAEPRWAEARDERADRGLERRLFAVALRDCAAALQTRARAVWLLRVFLELPSSEIARHPSVRMSRPAVDMMLMRCRRTIKKCMRRKGFGPADVPPGTFSVLWRVFGFELRQGDGR